MGCGVVAIPETFGPGALADIMHVLHTSQDPAGCASSCLILCLSVHTSVPSFPRPPGSEERQTLQVSPITRSNLSNVAITDARFRRLPR